MTLLLGLVSPPTATQVTPQIIDRVREMGEQIQSLAERQKGLAAQLNPGGPGVGSVTRLDIFHGYMGVLAVAFLVSLLATPILRRLALSHGIIDHPLESRKVHRSPVAYLGGVAVYLGLLGGLLFSYAAPFHGLLLQHPTSHMDNSLVPGGVPISVLLGMTVIMLVGLLDDVVKISPRVKIGGQLIAAAALALEDVGVKVAAGVMVPLAGLFGMHTIKIDGVETLAFVVNVMGHPLTIDLVYWTGTAVIAIFVLGACNASNLIDGLDGLLTGTTVIASAGLLIVALSLAMADDGPRDSSRIVLCLALLGACLGFLPHNFNPATIFLGDCGSLLMGYCTIVIVLTLGDTGKTHLVLAGLIIYAIPIIDTTLAIVRRKMSGRAISDADDQHLHHILRRALGVKGAVLVLYAIAIAFAALGVALSEGRGRITYVLAFIIASFIGVTALKSGRREQRERQAAGAGAAGAVGGTVGGAVPLPPATPAAPADTNGIAQPPGAHSAPPGGTPAPRPGQA